MKIVALLAAVALASPTLAATMKPTLDIQHLINREEQLSERCQGGHEDAGKGVCAKRDRLVGLIAKRGWCFGEYARYGTSKSWNPCLSGVQKRRVEKLMGQMFAADASEDPKAGDAFSAQIESMTGRKP